MHYNRTLDGRSHQINSFQADNSHDMSSAVLLCFLTLYFIGYF